VRWAVGGRTSCSLRLALDSGEAAILRPLRPKGTP
jgi:hypothetical protein